MNHHLLGKTSIRQRILLLALIPPVLITLLITAVLTQQRLSELEDELHRDAQLILNTLVIGAEIGLLSGNRADLEQLRTSTLTNPLISDLSILDARANPRAGTLSFPLNTLIAQSGGGVHPGEPLRFYRPVHFSTLPVDDFMQSARGSPAVLGWVVIEMNETNLHARQQRAVFMALGVALLGLLLALWLALSIAHTLLRPIDRVRQAIDALQQNQLSTRITPTDEGELGRLQEGINTLAAQVERTRSNLEGEVAAATRDLQQTLQRIELQNQQLDQARQQAEQANQTKDEFLARMSHELRTPLTSVLGFIGLLGKTPLNAQQQEYTSIVQRTSSLLLSLIDDILDFSKLASDAVRVEAIEFNLDDCLQETLEMHLPSARQKGVELIYVPDPSLPERLLGDPTRISQVINNLVSNAIKFTQRGEVAVSLRSRCRKSIAELDIEISDSGIGINKDHLEQLFQPFVQADTSITRRFGGSGLGLVISRKLTELMGGSLSLDSQEGRGTRVRVTLKLEAVSPAPPAQLFNGLPVLLYDRHALTRRAMRRRLAYWGCGVASVTNRRQLLQQLASHSSRYQRLLLSLSQRELNALEQASLFGDLRDRFSGELLLLTPIEPRQLTDNYPQLLALLRPSTILQTPCSGHQLVEALRGEVPANQPAQPEHSRDTHSLAGINILLAEDNAFNQMLIQRMMELYSAKVILADNGHQAIQRLQDEPVDVVLMDLHMPQMNGIEACRTIRQLDAPEARIPIITLTASTSEAELEPLDELQIFANLHKPINEAQLVDAVSRACQLDPPAAPSMPITSAYGVDPQALGNELHSLLTTLQAGVARHDINSMRECSHQLMGLAGLLKLEELDRCASAFNTAAKSDNKVALAREIKHLEQLIQTYGA